MRGLRGRIAAVAAVTAVLAAVPLAGALRSSHHPSAADRAASARLAHATLQERARSEVGGEGDTEAYADRAYPASDIAIDQIRGAIAANESVAAHGAKLTSKWDALGPETLNVDRLGTQAFNKATQWSGRVTALTVDPKCKPQECTLYVAAAGGGVWRSKNALAPSPQWTHISDGIPTNAIGSIAIDPNDKTGRTVYVGTGEGNGAADSEAGLGLYKTTDDGAHWTLVPGSSAKAANRSITWVAVEPGNASHVLFTTRNGTFGESSGNTQTNPPAAGLAPTGVYASTDGGASFALVQAGLANEVKFDPINSGVVYAAVAGNGAASTFNGLLRSTAGGAAGSWQPIFSLNRGRFSFAPVPNAGKTRIYLADASGGGGAAEVFRVDDASRPAATLTAGGNSGWTRISSPTPGTPGFAVHNFCNTPLASQCGYDMFVVSPPDRPDTVVVGGLMHYEELKPYALPGAMRSNGRAVLVSQDAGATWTDATGDVGGESMHPDQHAAVFVPGNPDQFFVASDGGVIRTNGKWADASAQCDTRHLSPPSFLTDCHNWLSRIPAELQVVNAGLGTLQMNSISVSQFLPDTAFAGAQDNGTLFYSGSSTWLLPLTGDGGDSGFDAVDPKFDFHSYTNGILDVNYDGANPNSWLWIGDFMANGFPEAVRFYGPVVPDTVRTKTIYVGANRVWRTSNGGGDRAFLEAHCNTAIGEFPSDLVNTGACGSSNDWHPLGATSLTSSATFGGTKPNGSITAMSRAVDGGTLWATTAGGRVFVSSNVDLADSAVTFTRIDTSGQPARVPSSVSVDSTNPNHAIVTFSGYESNTLLTPGHVFDVTYDPVAKTALWKNISFDFGDQPANDSVFDAATGDVYVSTDFTVLRLVNGTETWIPAADGMPTVAVAGLTLAGGHGDDRLLYAATHGRGAFRLRLK
jgi:hypothetical protein